MRLEDFLRKIFSKSDEPRPAIVEPINTERRILEKAVEKFNNKILLTSAQETEAKRRTLEVRNLAKQAMNKKGYAKAN